MNLLYFRNLLECSPPGTTITREDLLYVVDALVDQDEWREKTDHVIRWLACAVFVLAAAIPVSMYIVWEVAR